MDRPLKARVVGFSIFGGLALVILPWWFAEPVDPRGGIQSRFGPQPVVRELAPTAAPPPLPTVAAARAALPEARVPGGAAAVRPSLSAEPAQEPAPLPSPSLAQPAPKPAAPSELRWRLQLASYTDKASAERFVERLRDDGIEARISTAKSAGRSVWRVGFDFRASRAEANAALAKLNKRYRIQGLLTALD